MKLLDDIEVGIKEGNWGKVVKAYNKITGKNIEVPDLFNPKTANKKALYSHLTEKMGKTLQEMKEYTVAELRELVEFYNKAGSIDNRVVIAEKPDIDEELDDSESFLFITNPDAVPDELKNLKPRLKDFPVYGDEKPVENKTYRPPTEMIEASCKKCNRVVKMHPKLVVQSQGKNICVCEKCEDSR